MQKSVFIPWNGESNRICDILAEMLVEEWTRRDASTRCRLRVFGGEGMLMVAGCVDSKAELDISAFVLKTYTELTGKSDIEPFIHIEQMGKNGFDRSAWQYKDIGIAYGFATKETTEQLPYPIIIARRIMQRIHDARITNPLCAWMGYDGSTMVTMNKKQCRAIHIMVEYPDTMEIHDAKRIVLEHIIQPLALADDQTHIEIFGRSTACSGLKYMPGSSGVCDTAMTYTGLIPQSSHSFVGNDVYTPARIAIYEARRVAKQMLQKTQAQNVLVQLPYAEDRVLTERLYAISGNGEDISDLARHSQKRVEEYVEQFDLVKAPLRLLAEHHQFIAELAPWEMDEEL